MAKSSSVSTVARIALVEYAQLVTMVSYLIQMSPNVRSVDKTAKVALSITEISAINVTLELFLMLTSTASLVIPDASIVRELRAIALNVLPINS